MPLSQQVLVNYEYAYVAQDGRNVSIKPNEHYILVAKTNEAWWHVRKDETDKPFFIPAKYVTELPPESSQPELEPPKEFGGCDSIEPSLEMAPNIIIDNVTPAGVIFQATDSIEVDTTKEGPQRSTEMYEAEGLDPEPIKTEAEAGSVPKGQPLIPASSPTIAYTNPSVLHIVDNTLQSSEMEKTPEGNPQESTERPRLDSKTLNEDIQNLIRAGWPKEIWNMMDKHECENTARKPESPLAENDVTVNTSPVTSDTPLVEDDCALTAVYVNIPRVRRSPINSTSPISSPHQDQTFLDPAGWEVHTDHQSGLQYYYHPYSGRSSWERPLSSSMDSSVATEEVRSFPHSVACSPGTLAPQRWSSDWERLLDENTGRHYFFNSVSGQSSWDPPEDVIVSPGERRSLQECTPPLPVEDYPQTPELEAAVSPVSAPAEYSLIHVKKMSIPRVSLDHSSPSGWSLCIDPEGTWIFTSDHTQEQWIKSLDDRGRTYYYLRDGCKSLWKLPEYSGNNGQYGMGNGSTGEQDTLASNWRHSTGYHDEVSNLEKVGILNKTKVSENGKKIRKNWGNSWTVLHGGILTFHKDPKSTPAGASSKTNQIPPEFTVHLKGATINRATRDKSSKKNVLELKSRNGAEFLIQYDTESVISDWYKVIVDTIRQLDLEQHPSENEEDISDRCPSLEREEKVFEKRTMSNASRQHSTSSTSEADQKKVKIKLKKFLLKRPTLQSVKDKGYIRENVFGCHLQNLCNQEKSRVPSFVDKCISAVDKKGLGIDGLYRVSGNLAVIQKLRFKADHEDLDLEEGNWDIHVITGALKLFFRELQEPLFPYSLFNDFIFAIKTPDYYNKIAHMRNLVRSLPPANRDTMEALFSHLRRVIQHGDENRMTVQNVAIVFGPTLLKPEVETASIATYMVFQNQIVEFLLNEFESIFHNSQM